MLYEGVGTCVSKTIEIDLLIVVESLVAVVGGP